MNNLLFRNNFKQREFWRDVLKRRVARRIAEIEWAGALEDANA